MAACPEVHYIAAELDDSKRALLQQRPVQQPPLRHLFGNISDLPGPTRLLEANILLNASMFLISMKGLWVRVACEVHMALPCCREAQDQSRHMDCELIVAT